MSDIKRTSGNGVDFVKPVFGQIDLSKFEIIDEPVAEPPKINMLNVTRENKILFELGFGHYDYEHAFIENLPKSYAREYVALLKNYIARLDSNLQAGVSIIFRGVNGGGKTNGMATMVREVIRKKFDANAGIDGRVRCSMRYVVAKTMAAHAVEDEAHAECLYTSVSLLIVDDLRADLTEHRRSAFSHLICERFKQRGKPIFLTSALSDGEFIEKYRDIYSRLRTGITVITNPSDLRCLRK